eukprot:GHVS01039644.1.p1 GENE.GHVS01039644.1~~GHVS01039644.1.p1  ORF type:complete len:699 (+),score=81.17 GHVS01039644.1:1-2097(+)
MLSDRGGLHRLGRTAQEEGEGWCPGQLVEEEFTTAHPVAIGNNSAPLRFMARSPGFPAGHSSTPSPSSRESAGRTKNSEVPWRARGYRASPCSLMVIGPLCLAIAGLAIMRIAQEHFNNTEESLQPRTEIDYYEVLGVDREADLAEIKRSYRRLSLRWHPDKNVNCEGCASKFRDIAAAYAVIGDDEKREAYDMDASGLGDVISSRTAQINDDNYLRLLFENDNIWVVQVYSDTSSPCRYFAPIWEETASRMRGIFHFGRVNRRTQKKALAALPLKSPILPAVMVLSKVGPPRIYGGVSQPTVEHFTLFLQNNFPDLTTQMMPRDVSVPPPYPRPVARSYFAHRRPTTMSSSVECFLMSSPSPMHKLIWVAAANTIGEAATHMALVLKAMAYKYRHVFRVAVAHLQHLPQSFVKKWNVNTHTLLIFPTHSSSVPLGRVEFPSAPRQRDIEEAVRSLQSLGAPYLHRRNAETLCQSIPETRVYCLLLVDLPDLPDASSLDGRLSVKHVQDIAARYTPQTDGRKKKNGQRELKDELDEQTVIQPVRLRTKPSWDENVPCTYENLRFMSWWWNNNKSSVIFLDMDFGTFTPIAANHAAIEVLFQAAIDGFVAASMRGVATPLLSSVCKDFALSCLVDPEAPATAVIAEMLTNSTPISIALSLLIVMVWVLTFNSCNGGPRFLFVCFSLLVLYVFFSPYRLI